MGMPAIIMGGILLGIMTPTEAAIAGAAYAFILGYFVYGELKLAEFPRMLVEAAVGTACIVIIVSAAQPIGWVLTLEQAPLKVLGFFTDLHIPAWQLLLMLNVIFLVLGCFMEGLAIMIMSVPILLPLLDHAGIDPVHFGVIFTLNIMIGAVTPSVGMIMYVVCALGGCPYSSLRARLGPSSSPSSLHYSW
jgi:tripartite ATP-independent transporter DctM subunit